MYYVRRMKRTTFDPSLIVLLARFSLRHIALSVLHHEDELRMQIPLCWRALTGDLSMFTNEALDETGKYHGWFVPEPLPASIDHAILVNSFWIVRLVFSLVKRISLIMALIYKRMRMIYDHLSVCIRMRVDSHALVQGISQALDEQNKCLMSVLTMF
jgi:hypothetical protein